MWVRLEHGREDIELLFSAAILTGQCEADPQQLTNAINSNKPYMSQLYEKPLVDFEEWFAKCDPFLKQQYWKVEVRTDGCVFTWTVMAACGSVTAGHQKRGAPLGATCRPA